jgi:CopG family nickel-responsive transcriptional regulator
VLDSPAVARRHIAQDHRSLAVADMIRAGLVKHRQNYGDRDIAGTVTLLYDHHNCLEVLAVRGKAGTIKRIADELIAAKGVKHGKLTVTGTGKDLPA